MPMITAASQPTRTEVSVCSVSARSWPLPTISARPPAIADGAGRFWYCASPARSAISQSANASAMVQSPCQLKRARILCAKFRWSSGMGALPDGLMQQITQLKEFRQLAGDDLVARLRQIDRDR